MYVKSYNKLLLLIRLDFQKMRYKYISLLKANACSDLD